MHWSFTAAEAAQYTQAYRMITDLYRNEVNVFNPLDERIRKYMEKVEKEIIAARK
jgi:hypothetical protein